MAELEHERLAGADTVTLTRDEVLTGLNKPEELILAIGEIDEAGGAVTLRPAAVREGAGLLGDEHELQPRQAAGAERGAGVSALECVRCFSAALADREPFGVRR